MIIFSSHFFSLTFFSLSQTFSFVNQKIFNSKRLLILRVEWWNWMKENNRVTERKERVHEGLQIHSSPVPPSYLFFRRRKNGKFCEERKTFWWWIWQCSWRWRKEKEIREKKERKRLERKNQKVRERRERKIMILPFNSLIFHFLSLSLSLRERVFLLSLSLQVSSKLFLWQQTHIISSYSCSHLVPFSHPLQTNTNTDPWKYFPSKSWTSWTKIPFEEREREERGEKIRKKKQEEIERDFERNQTGLLWEKKDAGNKRMGEGRRGKES